MRKSPVNYLLALVIIVIFWLITGLLLGGFFSDSITLAEKSSEDFYFEYQLVSGIASLLTFLLVSLWFVYGSDDKVLSKQNEAKSKYTTFFISCVMVGVIAAVVLFILNASEGIDIVSSMLMFVVQILNTLLAFWLATFISSPSNVENIPYMAG
ncbi:MAG: hypothetical protein HUU43_07690 [Ignavibacteriaceae bacterium]|nr:hypothetical protein [Ignavibacteriaceae bacterium]